MRGNGTGNSSLLFTLLAFLLLALSPGNALADKDAVKTSGSKVVQVAPTVLEPNAYVYLGVCDKDAWVDVFADGLPSCSEIERARAFRVELTDRLKGHVEPSPAADTLVKYKASATITFERAIIKDNGAGKRFVWGKVSRKHAIFIQMKPAGFLALASMPTSNPAMEVRAHLLRHSDRS